MFKMDRKVVKTDGIVFPRDFIEIFYTSKTYLNARFRVSRRRTYAEDNYGEAATRLQFEVRVRRFSRDRRLRFSANKNRLVPRLLRFVRSVFTRFPSAAVKR